MDPQHPEVEFDPMRSSLRWAWKRGWKHLDRFLVAVVVFGGTGAVVGQIVKNPYLVLLVSVLVAIGVAFGFAVLRASYEQRDALRATTKDLRRQIQDQSPDFEGRIEQTITAAAPADPRTTVAHINMRILNRGAPSFVDNWHVFVTLGGVRNEATKVVIGDDTQLTMAGGGKPIALTSEDAIYEKGMAQIERGAQIRGWLRIDVGGVTHEEFVRIGNQIDVVFDDYLGKSSAATHIFHGSSDQARYFPGSNQPVR